MHTFLLGYEVESAQSEPLGNFLATAAKLHRDMAMPCTFFVRGQALEAQADAFRRVRDDCGGLVDFQTGGYAGIPLKTVCQESHSGVAVFRGGWLEECYEDIARAMDLMESALGVTPIGLAGPLGYYRGLSDRPDLLQMLDGLGIRFLRTYTRNSRDWRPVAFEVQPFRYEAQGFPAMLEIPGQGWPDQMLREALGQAELGQYIRHVRKDLDYVAAKSLTWSCVQTDSSCIQADPEMTSTRAVLEHARTLGFKVQTHLAYYLENAAATAEGSGFGVQGSE